VFVIAWLPQGLDASTVNVAPCICLSKSFCSWKYAGGTCLYGISDIFASAVAPSLLVGIIFQGELFKCFGWIPLLADRIHDLFND